MLICNRSWVECLNSHNSSLKVVDVDVDVDVWIVRTISLVV